MSHSVPDGGYEGGLLGSSGRHRTVGFGCPIPGSTDTAPLWAREPDRETEERQP